MATHESRPFVKGIALLNLVYGMSKYILSVKRNKTVSADPWPIGVPAISERFTRVYPEDPTGDGDNGYVPSSYTSFLLIQTSTDIESR